jgi:hypothetical protein
MIFIPNFIQIRQLFQKLLPASRYRGVGTRSHKPILLSEIGYQGQNVHKQAISIWHFFSDFFLNRVARVAYAHFRITPVVRLYETAVCSPTLTYCTRSSSSRNSVNAFRRWRWKGYMGRRVRNPIVVKELNVQRNPSVTQFRGTRTCTGLSASFPLTQTSVNRDTGCLKQRYSKCCCVASVMKMFTLKGDCTPSSVHVFVHSPQGNIWNSIVELFLKRAAFPLESHWTATIPDKTRCVLLHYGSQNTAHVLWIHL